jgi:hypothetical protein
VPCKKIKNGSRTKKFQKAVGQFWVGRLPKNGGFEFFFDFQLFGASKINGRRAEFLENFFGFSINSRCERIEIGVS